MAVMGIVAIVGAVVCAVAGLVVGWRPARKRPAGPAGAVQAEFEREFGRAVTGYGPGDVGALPFGFIPPVLQSAAPPFDVAVAFPYRGWDVLAFQHTVHGTGPGGVPATYPWTYVEVRTAPVPRLRLLGSAAAQREPHPPDTAGMRQVHIGQQAFDSAFAVYTEDDGFARALLPAPVAEYLAADQRHQHKHVSFEHGVVWLRMPAELTTDVVCVGADTLIDLLGRSPVFGRTPAQQGGAGQ